MLKQLRKNRGNDPHIQQQQQVLSSRWCLPNRKVYLSLLTNNHSSCLQSKLQITEYKIERQIIIPPEKMNKKASQNINMQCEIRQSFQKTLKIYSTSFNPGNSGRLNFQIQNVSLCTVKDERSLSSVCL